MGRHALRRSRPLAWLVFLAVAVWAAITCAVGYNWTSLFGGGN